MSLTAEGPEQQRPGHLMETILYVIFGTIGRALLEDLMQQSANREIRDHKCRPEPENLRP